ncbi:hypothetical protein L1987_70516 [Smallanthus sonchifolius]|uniref:Uncharacterized protein n=1 Tax=Smallanthus sonchifolius TaxID=185202 RepID=A0ACB9AP28_9ASTR|nr:hypothetical protein L1987_70516 [Smallanthus sonchifolius]
MSRPATDLPSFSSSLLDQIYRSIDEQPMVYGESARKKQSRFSGNGNFQNVRDVQRKIAGAENWMTKEVRSAVDFKTSYRRNVNSSSGSSDSGSGGGFSSSEAEFKPSRTGTNRRDEYITEAKQYGFEDFESKHEHEGKLVKKKSRAMKMYSDLKRVKQPISPGGRLATFLNSIFSTGNSKNTKHSSFSGASYGGGSTCSSASSFSRSCLSKTPSTRGKLGDNKNRSVKFVPPSLIVGDDCHRSVYGEESNLNAIKFVKNPSTEEAARNYHKKVECEFDLIKGYNEIDLNYEDGDDDDDAASHTSSDLFELENFSEIGMGSYGDELPVFETTHLNTNLAIVNGFLM